MNQGIHNYSEIGKLNKVLLHRLGDELEGLVPDNFERLLFDDIPYLSVAKEEHDVFAGILEDNGVEVVYYVEETARALAEPSVRLQFIKEFLSHCEMYSEAQYEMLQEHLAAMSPRKLVETVIAGIRKRDLPPLHSDSLADHIASGYPYYTNPMPNMYFTRDQGACIGNGISIHHMNTYARRRESLLLKYICRYNRDFAPADTKLWYDYDGDHSIEGGDILILSKEIIAIGLSQRTTAKAIETLAENLLGSSTFQKLLVFDIPKKRAFMHLDTVFTMVDYDKFTIHPEIEGPLVIYEVSLDSKGRSRFSCMQENLTDVLKKELALPAVDLIRCGGDDEMAAKREQWNDGANTLAIAPGVVITYKRNYVTNDILDRKGIRVLAMPSSELSRGRGGPRCMSCPVNRDDL